MSELNLSAAEARVVAALVEKSITTPQYYPMSVNAVMLAANQKSSRNPVMSLTEGDTGATLNQLEEKQRASPQRVRRPRGEVAASLKPSIVAAAAAARRAGDVDAARAPDAG